MNSAKKFILSFAALALGFGVIPSVLAQSDASSITVPAASTTKPTKAQRKQARKEARAKKNAELKKLEDAGYQPGRSDELNYPQNLQNAQKKAGVGQPASQ